MLRTLLGIKSANVVDLSIPCLWERIFSALEGNKAFVVLICGELRDCSPSDRSWAM
jgi:hypothetical protein